MKLTIEEARKLYKQGSFAKEIALREYSEEEILCDYSLITEFTCKPEYNSTIDLYAKIYTIYKEISRGRPLELTKYVHYYQPEIIISLENYKPRYGTYVGNVKIDDKTFSIYIGSTSTSWYGRLGWENNGVYCGHGVLTNKWAFKEKGQAQHFVKLLYKELIRLELGDFYAVKFL